MDLEKLEQRITRLEDLEAIKQLKARYCEICDDNHDAQRITSVFTEDAIWEGRSIARAQGHAEIKSLFENFQKTISYSQHMVLNPIIEVHGSTATGVWYFFGPFTFVENNQAMWQAARYKEDYEKVDGIWKIKHLRVKGPGMSAKYEAGWASQISAGRATYN